MANRLCLAWKAGRHADVVQPLVASWSWSLVSDREGGPVQPGWPGRLAFMPSLCDAHANEANGSQEH